MRFSSAFAVLGAAFTGFTSAQQYAGEVINTTLPSLPGSEIAFFKIPGVYDSKKLQGSTPNLTLINYYSHGRNGKRLVESNIQRAVIVIHGLNRDPGTYQSNMASALNQVTTDPNINQDTVAILSPYFPNGVSLLIYKFAQDLWSQYTSIAGQKTWQLCYMVLTLHRTTRMLAIPGLMAWLLAVARQPVHWSGRLLSGRPVPTTNTHITHKRPRHTPFWTHSYSISTTRPCSQT